MPSRIPKLRLPTLRNLWLPKTGDRFEPVRSFLEGRVFHVSQLSNLEPILKCGEIRPNDGSFVTTFGSTSNSFFAKRGCVCLFDYRSVTQQQLEDSIFKCSPTQSITPQSGAAIFIFSGDGCLDLQSWLQWKQEEAWGEQIVPT